MGVVQSVFCSIAFCVERVLTWTCCAFLLMLLMVYAISVGYHYAQKELASFAMSSRSTTESVVALRSGPENQPVVRLVAVNRTEVEHAPQPVLELYSTRHPGGEQVYLENTATNIILLETERPPQEPELSVHERDLAKRLIGRFRRSKNITILTTDSPFLRPLRNTTELWQYVS